MGKPDKNIIFLTIYCFCFIVLYIGIVCFFLYSKLHLTHSSNYYRKYISSGELTVVIDSTPVVLKHFATDDYRQKKKDNYWYPILLFYNTDKLLYLYRNGSCIYYDFLNMRTNNGYIYQKDSNQYLTTNLFLRGINEAWMAPDTGPLSPNPVISLKVPPKGNILIKKYQTNGLMVFEGDFHIINAYSYNTSRLNQYYGIKNPGDESVWLYDTSQHILAAIYGLNKEKWVIPKSRNTIEIEGYKCHLLNLETGSPIAWYDKTLYLEEATYRYLQNQGVHIQKMF